VRAPLLLGVLCAILAAGCGDHSVGETTPAGPKGPAASGPAASPAPAASAPAGAGVTTVSPEYRTRVSTLETTGKVQFNEDALVRVHAPITGRVVEVLARPGDVVESGARLLVLDSPDLGTAKSDYAKAVADAERAAAALGLARELYEVKAIAQKEIREAENDDKKALAERERAASRLRVLGVGDERLPDVACRVDVATTIVVPAPRSGVVVERNVAPGQVVSYGQSDTPVNLFVIADLSTMWVVADVYEPDVPRMRLGESVQVTLPCCPDDRYTGRVVNIADAVDKETRTLKVRAVVPNRGRSLKAEMFVKVVIGTGAARVLALPQRAIHRTGGQTFVLVVRGSGEYERRPVTLGLERDGSVEVLSGVTPEDRVVSAGGILLKRLAQ
jgi:cobalt-zinc-cadmium efflux system membrane fusion protein